MTNPPFGKDVKVQQETKALYENDGVDLIFLERALQLLKDKGILGIILPETVFHSPNNKSIRKNLFYKHNIMCMIDLPHDTFRPFNNAKCDVIFLQKNAPQQDKILAINVENIGHNHLGQQVFKYDIDTNTFDETEVNDDIPKLIKLLNDEKFMNGIKNDYVNNLKSDGNIINQIKYVSAQEVIQTDLLVARNYFEPQLNIERAVTLETLIDEDVLKYFDGHGSPQGHLKGLGDKPYIRVKDIVNLEVYINPLDKIPQFEYDRLFSEKKELKEKDIAFVRRGSHRIGDVGILYKKDLESIFTREILILRINKNDKGEYNNEYNLTPFNFLYLLNSEEVRKQLKNKIMIDTTLPNIADRWKKIYIPIYSKEKMNDISKKMEELYISRSEFWEKFSHI